MSETYGRLVQRLRDERGWTQRHLAEVSGLSLRTLQDVEGDKHDKPQRKTRLKINAALGIEGDPDVERADYSEGTLLILDIVAPYLERLTHTQQLVWLREFIAEADRRADEPGETDDDVAG